MLFSLFLIQAIANAVDAPICPNLNDLKGFSEMSRTHSEGKNPQSFIEQFKNICTKYPKELSCKVETFSKDIAKSHSKAFIKKNRCSEVFYTYSADQTTLYFMVYKN